MSTNHATMGIIVDKSFKNILLIKKKSPPVIAGMYNGPGGKLNKGEDALTCMRRECKEETGIVAEEWTSLGCVEITNPDNSHWMIHCFCAEVDYLLLRQAVADMPSSKEGELELHKIDGGVLGIEDWHTSAPMLKTLIVFARERLHQKGKMTMTVSCLFN